MNEFGRGNRNTRRKPAPMPLCPPQIPFARPGHEPGPPRWEATDYRFSYGTTQGVKLTIQILTSVPKIGKIFSMLITEARHNGNFKFQSICDVQLTGLKY
jgi:hypothetical protein